jgi:hypothetical protein
MDRLACIASFVSVVENGGFAATFRAEARETLRRQDRVRVAAERLQNHLNWLYGRLLEEKHDALRHGEHMRVDRVDRDIDELFDRFNAAVREDRR